MVEQETNEFLAECDATLEKWGHGALWFASFAVLLATPLAVSALFMALTLGRSLFDATPVWNDELIYWHGIGTFIEAGFNGGYYTFDELPAKATFTHFDAHGPFFFAIMGLLGSIGSWSAATAIVLNLSLLAAGSAVFVGMVRPSTSQLLLTALTVASSWAVVLFVPMTMQEPFHLAVAIVVAAILFRASREAEVMSLDTKITSVLFILCVGLVRPLWTFVLFALCYCWSRGRPRKVLFLNSVLILPLIPITFYFFTWCGAPYPTFVFSRHVMAKLFSSPLDGVLLLLRHVYDVVLLFGRGLLVEIAVRQQSVLLVCMASASIWLARRKPGPPLQSFLLPKSDAYTQLLSLGTLAVFLFSVHDIFDLRDFRTLAPHLLAAQLLLIAARQYTLVALLLFLNITTLSSALDAYQKLNFARYNIDQGRMDLFLTKGVSHIGYDRSAKNAWCNTVLTQAYDGYQFPPEVSLLPAGVGFSVILNEGGLTFPLKSKYLFIDEAKAARFIARMRLEKLESFGQLQLYRNIDSGC